MRAFLAATVVVSVIAGLVPRGTAEDLYRPRRSLWEDPVASRLGDVVIVHLDATKYASTVSGGSTTTRNSTLISLVSQQGLQSSMQSQTTWQTSLSGDMGARIVSVTPEGLYRVRGAVTVAVAGNLQAVTITGLLRPQDIASDDTVPASRLADVEATTTGRLTTVQQFSLLEFLGAVFAGLVLLHVLP